MSITEIDPWLVLRTRSRHEHTVESLLQQKRITAYLPTYNVVRSANGRKRVTHAPLFPGYVFVQPRIDQYEGMRYIRGSCGLVLADNKPARLPESDLHAVRRLVDSGVALTVDPGFISGTRVKIVAGPFMGAEGELINVKNQELLSINVEMVGSSVRVHVDRAMVAVL